MSEQTIFDKIVRRDIPADIVYEDDTTLAFRDINPVAPTHILVIPKTHIDGIDAIGQLSEAEIASFMATLPKVAALCGLTEGYRIVINNGRHGQQTVAYLHAHIIGGRQLEWPPG